jgi:hypothetical protein
MFDAVGYDMIQLILENADPNDWLIISYR